MVSAVYTRAPYGRYGRYAETITVQVLHQCGTRTAACLHPYYRLSRSHTSTIRSYAGGGPTPDSVRPSPARLSALRRDSVSQTAVSGGACARHPTVALAMLSRLRLRAHCAPAGPAVATGDTLWWEPGPWMPATYGSPGADQEPARCPEQVVKVHKRWRTRRETGFSPSGMPTPQTKLVSFPSP